MHHGLKIEAQDNSAVQIDVKKITKDKWIVNTKGINKIIVSYIYYAYEMDAGNSWLDGEQLYLNFINCLIYAEDRLNQSCNVGLRIPEDYSIATGLKEKEKHLLWAESYYQLVDSPMIASSQLHNFKYNVKGIKFNIWIQGRCTLDINQTLSDFEKFTRTQIDTMGEFPCHSYHFLIQALPYKHYHGVEHQNSTTITLGPAKELNQPELYQALLGISSHELFHTWNIIKIRPKEILPYDYTKENYFDTGFVAEGFTTYYGDLFLVRSGVLSIDWYLNKLNKILKRHFENFGRNNMSVSESSFDLWLDGYELGVPNRKVSIYNEGAIIALILDLRIRAESEHLMSLDNIMRKLWKHYKDYGSGYDTKLIISMLQECADYDWKTFVDNYIYGKNDILEILNSLLGEFGLDLYQEYSNLRNESHFGFRTNEDDYIIKIQPNSISELNLSLGDRIDNLEEVVSSTSSNVIFNIIRNYKPISIEMSPSGEQYFDYYQINKRNNPTDLQTIAFKKWLL